MTAALGNTERATSSAPRWWSIDVEKIEKSSAARSGVGLLGMSASSPPASRTPRSGTGAPGASSPPMDVRLRRKASSSTSWM
eukprot:4831791-Prymnesium_polylepis.1